MENIDITEIVVAVIGLLSALITAFVIPLLKKKLGDEKFAELQRWVEVAVHAAEQLYQGDKRGEEKKQYVLDFLKEKGFDVDSEEVLNALESAVHDMNETASSNEISINVDVPNLPVELGEPETTTTTEG